MVAFSDAIFAIAMTLLVLSIEVSGVPGGGGSARDMLEALADALPEIISFAVSFYVIGRYWLAHHWFFSRLQRIDRRLLSQNLAYLGFVAFLPFPTSLIGDYEGNPIAFVVFALSMAAVSFMEIIIAGHAYRAGLVRGGVPDAVWGWGLAASAFPGRGLRALDPDRVSEHDGGAPLVVRPRSGRLPHQQQDAERGPGLLRSVLGGLDET